MEYKEPKKYTHEEVENIVLSDNAHELSNMLVGVAFYESDIVYAYNIIYKFLNYNSVNIIGLSIICMAHLCRIHGQIPAEKTIDKFINIIEGPHGNDNEIRGRMGDAIGDFSVYQPEIYQAMIKKFPDYFKELGF